MNSMANYFFPIKVVNTFVLKKISINSANKVAPF